MSDESKQGQSEVVADPELPIEEPGGDTDVEGVEIEIEEAQAEAADDQAESEDESEAPPAAAQPTYIEQLTQKLVEKDRLLKEYIAAHKHVEEDFRKAKDRMQRDIARTLEVERGKLLGSLFEVLDNFERSLDTSKAGKSFDALFEGVQMVYGQLLAKLQEFGLRRFSPDGEPFDPETQEAMAVAPVKDPKDHNRVLHVIRPGYAVGDRVVRPALVQVGRSVQ